MVGDMSVDKNWKIVQGDSIVWQIGYSDPSGSAINLSGYSAMLMIRDVPGGSIFCASAGVGDGITLNSPSVGGVYINITPDKTKKFNYPKSAYQLQITSASGIKTTLMKGYFDVDAGVIEWPKIYLYL